MFGRRLHTSYLRVETAWSPSVLTAPGITLNLHPLVWPAGPGKSPGISPATGW